MRPAWLVSWLLLILSFALHAQEKALQFRTYTTSDGLTDDGVNCVVQTQNGYLWVGTNNGINRFDGYRFTALVRGAANKGLVGNHILQLREGAGGWLWVCASSGLSRINTANGSVESLPGFTRPMGIFDICFSGSVAWLATSEGLYSYDLHTRTLHHYFDTSLSGAHPDAQKLMSIIKDRRGRLWLGSFDGILCFDPIRGSFRWTRPVPGREAVTMGYAIADPSGILWFGTWNKGLVRVDPETGASTSLSLQTPGGLQSHIGVRPFAWKEGALWAGSHNGLLRISPDGSFKTQDNGRTNSQVTGGAFDSEGNLWVGSAGGLLYCDRARQPLPAMDLSERRVGRATETPWGVARDREGNCWIAFWDELVLNDPRTGRILHPGKTFPLLKQEGNNDVVAGSDGRIWLSNLKGLIEIRTRSGNSGTELVSVTRHVPDTLVPNFGFFSVMERNDGLWMRCWDGLMRYDPRQQRFFHFPTAFLTDHAFKGRLFGLAAGSGGNLYFSLGPNGIGRWNPDTRQFRHYPIPPHLLEFDNAVNGNIVFDREGRLLLSARNNGLLALDTLRGLWSRLPLPPGIVDAGGAFVSPRGLLYLYTEKGLLQLQGNRFRLFSYESGLVYPSGLGALAEGPPGSLLLCDHQRLHLVPDSLSTLPSAAPPVHLNEVTALEKSLAFAEGGTIRLNHDQNLVGFSWSGLLFSQAPSLRYAYRLDGVDRDWVICGNRRSVAYSNLAPGNYVFHVKAASAEGVWGPETGLSLRVLPAFWQTGTFLGLCILAGIGLLYALYRYRIRQILRLQELRSRLSRDLHDEMGSSLSSITLLSRLARQVAIQNPAKAADLTDRIGATSQRLSESINDLVWSINPENDDWDHMVARMRYYSAHMSEVCGAALHFEAGEDPELPLSPELRQQVYFIFKEAVNNAAKYSGARNLRVSLSANRSVLELIVQDDGRGFSTDASVPGNGLGNMQKRAAALGAQLLITSSQEGTAVRLQIPDF